MGDFPEYLWGIFGGGALTLLATFLGGSLSRRNEKATKAEEERSRLCDRLLVIHSRAEKLGKRVLHGGRARGKAIDKLLRDSSLILDILEEGRLLFSRRTIALIDEMWQVNRSYIFGSYPIQDWGHKPYNVIGRLAIERTRPLPWRLFRVGSRAIRKRWSLLLSEGLLGGRDEAPLFGFDTDVIIPAEAFEAVVRMCSRFGCFYHEFDHQFRDRKDGMVQLTWSFREVQVHREQGRLYSSWRVHSERTKISRFPQRLVRVVGAVTPRRIREVSGGAKTVYSDYEVHRPVNSGESHSRGFVG